MIATIVGIIVSVLLVLLVLGSVTEFVRMLSGAALDESDLRSERLWMWTVAAISGGICVQRVYVGDFPFTILALVAMILSGIVAAACTARLQPDVEPDEDEPAVAEETAP